MERLRIINAFLLEITIMDMIILLVLKWILNICMVLIIFLIVIRVFLELVVI